MDINWFAIIVVIVVIYIIRSFGEDKKGSTAVRELSRKSGSFIFKNEKNSSQWVNFREDYFDFGTTINFDRHTYDEIKRVEVTRQKGFLDEKEIVNIHISKNGADRVILLKIIEEGDVNFIQETISNRLKDYKRKIEIERLVRAKYKTGDFKDISPYDFEKVVGELFTFMGYSVTRVGGSGDGGVDLRCRNYSTGEKLIVQCKRYSGNVGVGIVRDFYGTLVNSKADKGYIVTTSEYTKGSMDWAKDKNIELIDGRKLSQLMMTYYK